MTSVASRSVHVSALVLGLLACVVLGVVAGFVSATPIGPKSFAIFGVLAIATWLVLTRQAALGFTFFFLVLVLEEFLPSLVVEDRTDRRLMVFYGLSFLGLPGVYPVDVMLSGLTALGLLAAGIARRSVSVLRDPLFLPLALTAGWIAIAAGISMFVFPDSTTPEAYNFDEIEIGLDADVAMLVPYMQFKSWTYVYLSYLLARLLLTNVALMRRFLWVVLAAAVGSIAIAGYRYGYYTLLKGEKGSLVYDDASLFVLTLVTCFFPLAWSRRMFPSRHMIWQALLMVGCAGVIVLSFRRATWLGFAMCLGVVFLLLPNRFKARTLMFGAVGAAGFLVFTVLSGGEESISMAVGVDQIDRQRSAIYRVALIHNMLRGDNFTLVGYGVKPLWNVPLIMGAFHFNYENVHNLYYWFILRTGLIGLALVLFLFVRALQSCWRLRREARTPWVATMAETLLIGFLLFMMLGWFHPIYGMARFVILLGLLCGTLMATRMLNERYPVVDPRVGRAAPSVEVYPHERVGR